MNSFSIPFMIATIGFLVSSSGLALFWYISSHLSKKLKEKNQQLKRAKADAQKHRDMAYTSIFPGEAPTLKQLTDLTMRLHGRASNAKSVEKVLSVGDVTVNGVEINQTNIKRIPICFSYEECLPKHAHVDDIARALQEILGDNANVRKTSDGKLMFTIEEEGFMYIGPVLLSMTYHDVEQIMERLQYAVSKSIL